MNAALILYGGTPTRFPEKFESTSQKGLFYWTEYEVLAGCWVVYSQAEGFPATEAFDDWFGYEKDAIEVAKKLAKGEL